MRKVIIVLEYGNDRVANMECRIFNHLAEIIQLGIMFTDTEIFPWGIDHVGIIYKILSAR